MTNAKVYHGCGGITTDGLRCGDSGAAEAWNEAGNLVSGRSENRTENQITRRWAKRGTRPIAPRDRRTQSATIFGATCPVSDKAVRLVLPWCKIDLNPTIKLSASVATPRTSYATVLDALCLFVIARGLMHDLFMQLGISTKKLSAYVLQSVAE